MSHKLTGKLLKTTIARPWVWMLTLALASVLSLPQTSHGEEDSAQHISIGSGGISGVYYTVGGAICRLVKRMNKKQKQKLDCRTESTAGSIYNLNTLLNKELDFAIVQADWHYQYAADESKGADLRSVLSLHTETFLVYAHPDSGISTFADLKGKKVNIGNPGSGQRGTMMQLMDLLGWTDEDFLLATELKASEQGAALCDGSIDAAIYTVGNPAAAIQEAITICKAKLISISPEIIARLIEKYPYYRSATINKNTYSGQDYQVNTFGLSATLVTHADVDTDTVKTVSMAILTGLGALRRAHPSLSKLSRSEMTQVSNFAELHPGALEVMNELKLAH